MIGDINTVFFNNEEVFSTKVSKSVKVGAPGRGGAGSMMYNRLSAVIRCSETFSGLTSIDLEFVESDDDETWTPIKGGGKLTFTGAEMIAGEVVVNQPVPNSSKAYIAMRATVTGTPSTGKITAELTTGNEVY